MDQKDTAIYGQMAPLSTLDDYEVADDSVDVRGWDVTGNSGADIGKVQDLLVDSGTMKAHYLVVELRGDASLASTAQTGSGPVLVPVSRARLRQTDKRVELDSTGAGLSMLPRFRGDAIDRDYNETFTRHEAPGAHDADEQRLTLAAEELRIGKRRVSAGEVKVEKHVETERTTQPVTRMREEVHVERRPVSGADSSRAEIRDDEIRIPITEEELIVEKRPVVKEELVVSKTQVQEQENVEADLRKERADVERVRGSERHADTSKPRNEV